MKKALVLLALSLTMLPSMAANQRLWITGYRIGDSEIMANDDHRIFVTTINNETNYDWTAVSNNRLMQKVYFGVSVPAGQKVLRWMAYDSNPIDTIPEQSNQFADAVTQYVWSYNSSDTADKYIVVDFDYIKYNLSYQANGGSGELPSSKNGIVYADSVEISTNELVRKGYTWSGWTNNLTTTVWMGGETVSGSNLGVNWHADGSNVVLRSKWMPNKYTISFDKNTWDEVSGEMSPMVLTYDMPTNLPPNAFVRVGYRFSGWATKKDGDVTSYEDEESVVNITSEAGATQTLYAVWAAKKFTIKYHRNDRNDGTDETRIQGNLSYDTPTEIVSVSPRTGSGYQFDGWATSPDGAVQYKAGEKYQIDPGDKDIIDLYAVWSPIVYSVGFNANGGEGEMKDVRVEYEKVYVVPECEFTKSGVDFLCWVTNVAGGVEFYAGDSVSNLTTKADGTVTFYAVWSEPKYVAFDGNGADNCDAMAEDVMAFEGEETKALVPNKFEKAGYSFAGWATNETDAAALKIVYTNCADVVSADLWMAIGETNVFCAVWTANVYTVSFNPSDPNGGTVPPTSKSVTYDAEYGKLPTPNRDGYGFAGWYTDASGGSEVTKTNVVKTAKNHVLYAHWSANPYTVKFDKQGGTGGSDSVTATYGAVMPSATMPTREGYTFAGYYSGKNGGRTKYYEADGSSTRKWIKPGDGELYAYWTANKYAVTFDANGGNVASTSGSVTYAEAYGELPTPTRTGYTFNGWYTTVSGGSKVTLTSAVTTAEDQALYAHWTTNTYTVTFDANGGTVSPTSKSVGYDAEYGEMPTATRLGYKFDGWYTTASGGSSVTATDVVKVDKDQILYAHWSVSECTVTFDANGGTVPSTSKGATYAEAYGELPTPTRPGYKFDGWYTAVSGGSPVTATTTVTTPSNHILHAEWVGLRYIAFDGNGADRGSMADDVMIFSGIETKTLVPNEFGKTGYTFAGWATNATDAAALKIAYANCDDVVSADLWAAIGETNVVYAVWQTNKYTVVFNANGGAITTNDMEDLDFYYGHAQELSEFGFVSDLDFGGWATNQTGDAVFSNMATVANLTAEANGIVMLYAVWGNGDLSKAMHCDNLAWTMSETGTDWQAAYGENEGYNPSGSSVSNMIFWTGAEGEPYLKSKELTFKPSTTGGILSFWYKTSSADEWNYLYFNGEKIESSTTWRQYGPVHVDKNLGAKIYFEADKDKGEYDYTVWIDQMKWEPDGAELPEDFARINLLLQNAIVNGVEAGEPLYSATGTSVSRGHAGPRVYCTAEAEPIEGVVFDCWELTVGKESSEVAYVTNSNPLILDGKYSCFANPSDSNCYVRAKFKWLEYNIDYNANGDHGTVTPDQANHIYTDNVELKPAADPAPGYSLAGWATNTTGEVVFAPGQVVTGADIGATASGGVTLYANWTQNVYSVTFCYKNSEGVDASTDRHVLGTEDALPPDAAEYDSWPCHKFIGWDADFSNVVGNVTVNAKYLDCSYIAFDGNGADNPDAMLGDVVAFEGVETKTLTPNKFEKTGYTFAGWATSEADAAALTDCADVISTNLWAAIGETNTLYAVWAANVYTVVFDGNGGTSEGNLSSVVTNVAYGEKLKVPVFTRSDNVLGERFYYVLDEWTCGDTSYATNAVVSNLTTTAYAIVKMKAKWLALVDKPEPNSDFGYDGLEKVGIAEKDGYSLVGNVATNADSYTVTVTLEEGYVWSDGTTDAWKGDWSIARATYDMSGVMFIDKTFVADGTPKSLAISGELPDSVEVSYDGNDQVEPGVYTVTAKFAGDETNYEPIPDMTAKLTIVAKKILVPIAANGLVYNGAEQMGVTNGVGYTLIGNVETNAGEYVAKATPARYCVWPDGSSAPTNIQWSIAKVTYDMSGVTFKDKTVVADGTPKSIEISGTLPDGVKVSYVGNGKTEPGTYPVTAKFTGDSDNYESISNMTATLTITAQPISIAVPTAVSGLVYDGSAKTGVVEKVGYLLSGNIATNAGSYTATAKLEEGYVWSGGATGAQTIQWFIAKATHDDPDPGPGPEPGPEKTPDLYPSGVAVLGAFTAEKAETYNGWLKDDDERIVALLTVKTTAAKSGKQTKSTITVTPANGKKYRKKTSLYPGGNPIDEFGIVYGARGLLGTFGGYSVEASVDVYKSKISEVKALAAKIPVATHTFSIDTGNGMAVFSAAVAKTGKTKVQGYLEDGAKISVSTTGALGENYFAVPVVSSKAATKCGFVLWLPLDDDSPTLANFYDSNWTASLSGGSYALSNGEHVFDFDEPDFRDYLASVDGFAVAPVGAVFTVKRSKWDAGKTVGRLKVIDGAPAVTGSSSPSNLSALKLTYTAKSGLVKGSFKLYYMDGKRLKYDKVTVAGVVVGGKLFGSGTVKKLGSFAVWAE